ncbi:hypothetical protein MPLB_630035 [Mesorhizobium sp. ORS 3324]|nr:hypothetical protein MPLB_630035 [Mesorhizobium sp. ORS 3324]
MSAWAAPLVRQYGTQKLTASPLPVQKPVHKLRIFGAQAVDNTISWGEQNRKDHRSLIRRRFVPALAGKLT